MTEIAVDNRIRYEYLQRLDVGMSVAQVWQALDLRLESSVIIKKFGLNSDARTAALHYGSERDALVRGLAFVPRLIDTFVEEGGVYVIVRDAVPGRSLRMMIEQDGPVPYTRACRIARAAATIAYRFHTNDPHPLAVGDMHAANFILEDDDTLWFVGGGSTTLLSKERGSWSPTKLGPYAYAAPELKSGATVRTDVWGIGALLYYLLTGHPVTADTVTESLERIHRDVADLPDELVYFLRVSLAAVPEERFETALIAADALKILAIHQPDHSDPNRIPDLPALAFRRIAPSENQAVHAIRRNDPGSLQWAKLSSISSSLRNRVLSDELTAIDTLDIVPFPHQLDTARRILNTQTMVGGAILADEVGLGKTIEALIVLQELRARGLASTALIVAQPQGVFTWSEEIQGRLRGSAYEQGFRTYTKPSDAGYPWLVVSAATLRQTRHREALAAQRYDIVVADEAHTLTGADGKPNALGRAISGLSRRRVLLLTATPVRRRLRELYTLVSIIRPGFLGTMDEFVERFEAPTDQADAERRALRAVLDGIMIRHRRRDLPELSFPSRSYRTLVYNATRAANVVSGKVQALAEFFRVQDSSRRAVVFSGSAKERIDLEIALREMFPDRDIMMFTGDRTERRQIARTFQYTPGAMLIAGDTGTEGMNWQTADIIVHSDIPWSPSVWEQRVGRVYRLGQKASHVEIVHLVRSGGRDEAVLALYEHAMGLFDLAIGEASSLLDYVPDPAQRDVSVRLTHAFEEYGVKRDFQGGNAAFDALSSYREVVSAARVDYKAACVQSDLLDELFGMEI